MAALPYLQLYVADYLADTAHLSTLEHGAYLLLIMNYWQRGEPFSAKDQQTLNRRLAAVARMDQQAFDEIKETLAEFFVVQENTWVHSRIERDLDAVRAKSTKAKAAGKASGLARMNKRSTDGEQTFNHTDTDTDTDTEKDKPTRARARADLDLSKMPGDLSTEVWADYWQWRKQQKLPINQVVVDRLAAQLHKCMQAGYSPDDAIITAMERGWRTVKLDWLEREKNEISTRSGSNPGRTKQVADKLDEIIRFGLPEERAQRMGGGNLPQDAGDLRQPLDGEYRRHRG